MHSPFQNCECSKQEGNLHSVLACFLFPASKVYNNLESYHLILVGTKAGVYSFIVLGAASYSLTITSREVSCASTEIFHFKIYVFLGLER